MVVVRDLQPLPPPLPRIPLLYGRTSSVKLQGPTEAALMILLWENLLCKLDPSRDTRDAHMYTRGGGGPRLTAMKVVPSLAYIPNEIWQSVAGQTYATLPVDICGALWAPVLDPDKGGLMDDPRRECRSRIAKHLRYLNSRARHWLFSVIDGQPHAEYQLPGLRLRVEPPILKLRDRDNMIHSPNGPAVVYQDGTCVFYWRGTMIPTGWLPHVPHEWEGQPLVSNLLLKPDFYSPPTAAQALKVENVEQRRAACEILGWDAIIDQLHGFILDKDPDPEIGTLVAVDIPAGREWELPTRQHFLRVRCGTGRSFSLAVPPECRTAREANAWTYGLEPHEYQPEVRT